MNEQAPQLDPFDSHTSLSAGAARDNACGFARPARRANASNWAAGVSSGGARHPSIAPAACSLGARLSSALCSLGGEIAQKVKRGSSIAVTIGAPGSEGNPGLR